MNVFLSQLFRDKLNFEDRQSFKDASATLTITELNFKLLMAGQQDAASLIAEGDLIIEGDIGALAQLADLLDQFECRFPLVTPRDPWDSLASG